MDASPCSTLEISRASRQGLLVHVAARALPVLLEEYFAPVSYTVSLVAPGGRAVILARAGSWSCPPALAGREQQLSKQNHGASKGEGARSTRVSGDNIMTNPGWLGTASHPERSGEGMPACCCVQRRML